MTIITESQWAQIDAALMRLRGMTGQDPAIEQMLRSIERGMAAVIEVARSKPPQLTAAEQMHQGCFAEMHVEEIVDVLWPDLIGCIGSDHYDNSLELFFVEEATAAVVCTEAQAAEVFKLGFSRFWLNFCDGTEQYIYLVENQIHVTERKKANIPRGGARQSALRSKLYAFIDRLEARIKELEAAPSVAVDKLNLVAVYVEHGPMTKADFEQLIGTKS